LEGKRSAGKLTEILGHNKSEEVLRSIAVYSLEGKRSAGKLTEILGHNKSEEVLRSIAEDVDLSEDDG
jgi:hypothetical protein